MPIRKFSNLDSQKALRRPISNFWRGEMAGEKNYKNSRTRAEISLTHYDIMVLDNIVEHHHEAGASFLASRKEIRFTARGKGQPVLFGAAVCHPEQFYSLIPLLICHRTDARGDVIDCRVCIPIHVCHLCCTFVFVWHKMFAVYAH